MWAPIESLVMDLLRHADPERACGVSLWALRHGLGRPFYDRTPDAPMLRTEAFGLHFANPIGLAAGLDKDAIATLPLMRLGFGFVEVGSVTPLPQTGSPRPRMFRLAEDHAVINRMGMNGEGAARVEGRLKALGVRPAVLGVSVAINKDGVDPERDYPALVARFAAFADYMAINVSSPNTPGLRDLQAARRLGAILRAINGQGSERPPLLVKIAPDLDEEGLGAVVETAVANGVAGLIVGNTTTARPANLRSRAAGETGGLSGAPLFARSTQVLARAYRLADGRLPLIGCGGVSNGREALAKIRAGASLVQILTAFRYEGPRLIPRVKAELAEALRRDGFASIAAAVGVDAERIGAEGVARAA